MKLNFFSSIRKASLSRIDLTEVSKSETQFFLRIRMASPPNKSVSNALLLNTAVVVAFGLLDFPCPKKSCTLITCSEASLSVVVIVVKITKNKAMIISAFMLVVKMRRCFLISELGDGTCLESGVSLPKILLDGNKNAQRFQCLGRSN